jgi:iron complex outermembrane receptor protein
MRSRPAGQQAWALFASGEYDRSTDAFTLRGGLRYTRDEKDFSRAFESPQSASAPARWRRSVSAHRYRRPELGPERRVCLQRQRQRLRARRPRVSARRRIQGRLLFGNVVSVADSETVLSLEAGIKADSVGAARALAGFAVFHYTRRRPAAHRGGRCGRTSTR